MYSGEDLWSCTGGNQSAGFSLEEAGSTTTCGGPGHLSESHTSSVAPSTLSGPNCGPLLTPPACWHLCSSRNLGPRCCCANAGRESDAEETPSQRRHLPGLHAGPLPLGGRLCGLGRPGSGGSSSQL
jgi:hypothetical protein